MPLDHSHSKSSFTNNIKTLMGEVGKSPHVQSRKQAEAIAYATEREPKGRAFGGVAPMMSQAMQSTMPAGSNPAQPPMPSQGMAPGMPQTSMPQTPSNAPPAGVVPAAPMPVQMGPPQPPPGPGDSKGFAFGGAATPITKTFKGPIISSVPGRTDRHRANVPSGAFVIPADIVSAHGEGNTLAGMGTLQKLFKMGPHAAHPSKTAGALNNIKKMAKGGSADQHVGKPVPVILAGGEIVVPPENVHETMSRVTGKKLSLSEAHAAMDKWVINERKKLRKTLAKLPGPARD